VFFVFYSCLSGGKNVVNRCYVLVFLVLFRCFSGEKMERKCYYVFMLPALY